MALLTSASSGLMSVSCPSGVSPLTLMNALSATKDSMACIVHGPTNERVSALKLPPSPTMLAPEGSAVEKRSMSGTRVARQNASGRVVRRSRRIDEHALVGPKQPRSRPREPLLRLDRLAKALLERVLVLRETGRNRPTMRPLYLPLTLEHHKVTPRSGRRDAKLLLEPGHRDAPRLA
jgi:hypothetical protein